MYATGWVWPEGGVQHVKNSLDAWLQREFVFVRFRDVPLEVCTEPRDIQSWEAVAGLYTTTAIFESIAAAVQNACSARIAESRWRFPASFGRSRQASIQLGEFAAAQSFDSTAAVGSLPLEDEVADGALRSDPAEYVAR